MKERSAVIDSQIVKVMKMGKNTAIRHLDLINEVMEMIKLFKAQPDQIKARIEYLIDMQYMRRDEDDRSKYWYVA